MRKVFVILLVLALLTACADATDQSVATTIPFTSTPEPDPATPTWTPSNETPTAPVPGDDFFSRMGITLAAPTCTGQTQPQTEGPYYRPDTPERNSLLEQGLQGTRLILVGYVLDQNCQPLSNAWLDFWQADASGEYDHNGYRLRGHQFTDGQGRYHLETILPGMYLSRPIEHIHVKVRPEGGGEVTSQLYFPEQPVDGLTVTIEDRSDYLLGYFNFVVPR